MMDKKEERFRLTRLPEEVASRGREIWLAGLGAFAAVEEEGNKVFTHLVERGSKMEEEGKSQLGTAYADLTNRQQRAFDQARDTASGVENMVFRTMTAALEGMGVPTRQEVNRLSEQVEDLSVKVDALAAILEKRPSAAEPGDAAPFISTYHVEALSDDAWSIKKEGAAQPLTQYDTKKEALEKGRKLAEKHEPSRLVVHRKDGSVQETFAYGDEA